MKLTKKQIKATYVNPRAVQYKLEEIIESYGIEIGDVGNALLSYISADEAVAALKDYCKLYLNIDGDELEAMLKEDY